jgi:hypothetical protein
VCFVYFGINEYFVFVLTKKAPAREKCGGAMACGRKYSFRLPAFSFGRLAFFLPANALDSAHGRRGFVWARQNEQKAQSKTFLMVTFKKIVVL